MADGEVMGWTSWIAELSRVLNFIAGFQRSALDELISPDVSLFMG
jgi:hypothetical protein